MLRKIFKGIKNWTAALALTCAMCSSNTVLSNGDGSGTRTGNPGTIMGVVIDSLGKPVKGASVFLRRDDYLVNVGGGLDKTSFIRFDTVTNDSGRFVLDSIDSGSYTVEVNNGYGCAVALKCKVADNGKHYDEGIITITPVGLLQGHIPQELTNGNPIYVQIYGLERLASVNQATGAFWFSGLPAGEFSLHCASTSAGFTPVDIGSVKIVPDSTSIFSQYASWKYSAKITLNTTVTGADVQGNVYNFPVLIRLTDSNFVFNQANAGGGDLRFTKADGTPLSYEVERWDPVTERAEVWVRLDTVYGNSSDRFFTMYWGNAAAPSESNPAAVFDTAAGFAGVWHLGAPAGAVVPDATANGNNGAATATTTVSGAIGAAQSFDGASGMIQTSGPAEDKLNFPDSGTYSVSAWVKTTVLDSLCQAIVFKSNAQYGMQIIPEKVWEFATYIDKTKWEGSRSPASADSWHALAGVRNGTKQYLYVDGKCADSSMTNTIALPPENVSRVYDKPLEIGHCPDGGRNPDRFFNGIIDEVRISRTPLNPDWIKLCYMNQKQQDALLKW